MNFGGIVPGAAPALARKGGVAPGYILLPLQGSGFWLDRLVGLCLGSPILPIFDFQYRVPI